MFLYVLCGIGLLILLFVLYIISLPAKFTIKRSTIIEAKPEQIFSYVNDLHKFQDWSPWSRRDPAMNITFEGPESGDGAVYRWDGNKEVGQGSMKIVESRTNELVAMKLIFLKPFPANNTVEFSLEQNSDQTEFTWTMLGKNNFVGKVFALFMDLDKMVGKDFEEGFANLKELVETK